MIINKRSKFTIDELRKRERHHRQNTTARTATQSWNKSEEVVTSQTLAYRATQESLANVYAELIAYRQQDRTYKES